MCFCSILLIYLLSLKCKQRAIFALSWKWKTDDGYDKLLFFVVFKFYVPSFTISLSLSSLSTCGVFFCALSAFSLHHLFRLYVCVSFLLLHFPYVSAVYLVLLSGNFNFFRTLSILLSFSLSLASNSLKNVRVMIFCCAVCLSGIQVSKSIVTVQFILKFNKALKFRHIYTHTYYYIFELAWV